MLVTTRMEMNARLTAMTRNRVLRFLSQTRDAVRMCGDAGEDASTGVPVERHGVLICSQ